MTPRFRTLELSDPRFTAEGLHSITAKSAHLRGRGDITIWLPPAAPGPLPLVILLHGVYGSHWAWTQKAGAHRTAARLTAAGEIPPLALAMPSDGLWGDGSGYVRQPGADFERWIVDDVPAAVSQLLPSVRSETAGLCVAGLSMGGFGALRLGARYPERFRAFGGLSSITDFAQMAQFVEEPLESYAVPAEDRSVLDALLRARDRLPPFRFDCGRDDPLIAPNRELHAALERAGVAHGYAEHTGGHEWVYWETHLAEMLRFFGRALAG